MKSTNGVGAVIGAQFAPIRPASEPTIPLPMHRLCRKWHWHPVSGENGFAGFDLRHDLDYVRWSGRWKFGTPAPGMVRYPIH
jgi:hypothetical protein